MASKKTHRRDTVIAHAGSNPAEQRGAVNPPVYHASTVAHESLAAMRAKRENADREFVYGRRGTPTSPANSMTSS